MALRNLSAVPNLEISSLKSLSFISSSLLGAIFTNVSKSSGPNPSGFPAAPKQKKFTGELGKAYIPSKSASETSSLVTLNARSRMAMFWDFFESSILISCLKEGSTNFLVASLVTELIELHPNSVSTASSFNLQIYI